MRSHEDFLPELDLVAEKDGVIVGSIMYTKATLTDESGKAKSILTFGRLQYIRITNEKDTEKR